ncbi:MAG: 4-hydroxybenzoate octaprenyltransferase [Gammaproteobacteria bacterium]|nr:4-hydroxybenzoate octaprenyltransferase [Gammaproteobacteria bacterium]MDH5801552.1 4-hydroxybenzoate octaprenyltransferase [Gammaproteobacteria bacterium]
MKDRSLQYALLMRFDRPIGIYLLLWPTLWALWIAGKGFPSVAVTFIFLMGVILMRAGGCIINDYADRGIDMHVSRTQNRPLAMGRVTSKEALSLFVVTCLAAFVLVLFTNTLTILMSVVGLFLAVLYPFTKRYTYMPQAFLGLAFGWSVPMAFAAQTGTVPNEAWLILTATVLWATSYDTMYAMADREDDIRIGVKSTAVLFGEADRLIIAMIQCLFLFTMIVVGEKLELKFYYYIGLGVSTIFLAYQHYLLKDRDPQRCIKAFANNSWLGACIFAGIVMEYASKTGTPTNV